MAYMRCLPATAAYDKADTESTAVAANKLPRLSLINRRAKARRFFIYLISNPSPFSFAEMLSIIWFTSSSVSVRSYDWKMIRNA